MGLETVPGTEREVYAPAPGEQEPIELPTRSPVESPAEVPTLAPA